MESLLSTFTVVRLRDIARVLKLKVSGRKAELVARLCKPYSAVIKIQSAFRYSRLMSERAKCINDVDPITQEKVEEIEHPFRVNVDEKQFCLFDAMALGDSILQTGKTTNWVTTTPLSDSDLARLDALRAKIDPSCKSILANLSQAVAKAEIDHERLEIDQCLATEVAEAWAWISEAPFSMTPHDTISEVAERVGIYLAALRDYSGFDEAAARAMHDAHCEQFKNVKALTGSAAGDKVIIKSIDRFLLDSDEEVDDITRLLLAARRRANRRRRHQPRSMPDYFPEGLIETVRSPFPWHVLNEPSADSGVVLPTIAHQIFSQGPISDDRPALPPSLQDLFVGSLATVARFAPFQNGGAPPDTNAD